MDYGALKKDIHKALSLLPPGLVDIKAVAERILQFKPQLDGVVPQMVEMLKPHLMAGMMEAGMGYLDKDELEREVLQAVVEFTGPINGAHGG